MSVVRYCCHTRARAQAHTHSYMSALHLTHTSSIRHIFSQKPFTILQSMKLATPPFHFLYMSWWERRTQSTCFHTWMNHWTELVKLFSPYPTPPCIPYITYCYIGQIQNLGMDGGSSRKITGRMFGRASWAANGMYLYFQCSTCHMSPSLIYNLH